MAGRLEGQVAIITGATSLYRDRRLSAAELRNRLNAVRELAQGKLKPVFPAKLAERRRAA